MTKLYWQRLQLAGLLLASYIFIFMAGVLWTHIRLMPTVTTAVHQALVAERQQQPKPAVTSASAKVAEDKVTQPSSRAASEPSSPVAAPPSYAHANQPLIPNVAAALPSPVPTPAPIINSAPNTIAMTGANSFNLIANITSNVYNWSWLTNILPNPTGTLNDSPEESNTLSNPGMEASNASLLKDLISALQTTKVTPAASSITTTHAVMPVTDQSPPVALPTITDTSQTAPALTTLAHN
jgi:hypothetical protein